MFLSNNNNSPYYHIVYFVNGKRTKKSTKKKNREEAQKFLEEFKREMDNDKPPTPVNSASGRSPEITSLPPALISLSQFRDEYVAYVKKFKAKSYIKSIEFIFKKLIDFTSDIPLMRLTTKILDNFITITYSRSKSSGSLYYRTLKAAFTKAVFWEYIQDNPFRKIKSPKMVKSFPVFITKEELEIINSKTEDEYLKDIFTTAFHTGMRLGELVNMKWNWIDLEKGTIKVKCNYLFNTKSKKERIIPVNETLKKVLQNQFPKVIDIKKDNYVFTRVEGIKLNEDFVSKQFKKAVRAGELSEEIHFHTLRHSFASNLVQKGVSLYVVKELLGHEDLKTTQIYSHLQPENLMQAVNLL